MVFNFRIVNDVYYSQQWTKFTLQNIIIAMQKILSRKKKKKNIRTLITNDYSDNRFDFRSFKYIKYFIKTLQNICCLQTTFKQLKTGEKQLGTYLCNFDIN